MTNRHVKRTREETAQKKKKDRDANRKLKLIRTDPEHSETVENGLLDMIFGIRS